MKENTTKAKAGIARTIKEIMMIFVEHVRLKSGRNSEWSRIPR